jgi:1-acyl-sn-glycerol-3-phosphate acyltransferase
VLIANHLSYIDPLVLAALQPMSQIAKGELAGWPLLGDAMAAMGVVFVRRGDAWSGALALREGLRILRSGVSVLGFPEGTTTHGDTLLPFRRGLFGLARIARVPLVPISITYSSHDIAWVGDDWFLPHYLRTAGRPTTSVEVRIGKPVPSHSVGRAEELALVLRTHVGHLLWRDEHVPTARPAVPATRPDPVLSSSGR